LGTTAGFAYTGLVLFKVVHSDDNRWHIRALDILGHHLDM